MRLGILTQCHFPSLTWKECTSHNRLHHPAIKPCQGTTFLAVLGQLWRERSTQTHTQSTEGPPLLPQPYPATPCSQPWPLTYFSTVTDLRCVVSLQDFCRVTTLSRQLQRFTDLLLCLNRHLTICQKVVEVFPSHFFGGVYRLFVGLGCFSIFHHFSYNSKALPLLTCPPHIWNKTNQTKNPNKTKQQQQKARPKPLKTTNKQTKYQPKSFQLPVVIRLWLLTEQFA